MNSRTSTPSGFNWLIGAVCCVLTVVLCQVASYLVFEARQALAFRQLRIISSSNTQGLDHYLAVLTTESTSWIASLFDSGARKDSQLRDIDRLGLAMKQAQQGSFSTAVKTISTISQFASGDLGQDLVDQLQDCSDKRQRVQDLEDEHRQSIAQLEGAQLSFAQIRSEFADFLTLPTPEGTLLDVYQQGILKGLPTLPNLEGNISDAAQLKENLVELHGAVKLSGADAPELFIAKISELRSATSKGVAEIESRGEQSKNSSEKLAASRKDLAEARSIIQSKLSAAMLELAAPRGFFSGILTKNWLNLPSATP